MPYKDTPEGRIASRANQQRYRDRHKARLLIEGRRKNRAHYWRDRPLPADLPGEEWRPVAGYEGWYDVSNMGRVRSYWSRGNHQRHDRYGLLKPHTAKTGYLVVNLSDAPDKPTQHCVHRLVAVAFLGDPPSDRHEVNHKDGIKTNATLPNLEWVTASGNMSHAVATGLHRRKLSEAKRAEIRALAGQRPVLRIAREYGVSTWMVDSIIKSR